MSYSNFNDSISANNYCNPNEIGIEYETFNNPGNKINYQMPLETGFNDFNIQKPIDKVSFMNETNFSKSAKESSKKKKLTHKDCIDIYEFPNICSEEQISSSLKHILRCNMCREKIKSIKKDDPKIKNDKKYKKIPSSYIPDTELDKILNKENNEDSIGYKIRTIDKINKLNLLDNENNSLLNQNNEDNSNNTNKTKNNKNNKTINNRKDKYDYDSNNDYEDIKEYENKEKKESINKIKSRDGIDNNINFRDEINKNIKENFLKYQNEILKEKLEQMKKSTELYYENNKKLDKLNKMMTYSISQNSKLNNLFENHLKNTNEKQIEKHNESAENLTNYNMLIYFVAVVIILLVIDIVVRIMIKN